MEKGIYNKLGYVQGYEAGEGGKIVHSNQGYGLFEKADKFENAIKEKKNKKKDTDLF